MRSSLATVQTRLIEATDKTHQQFIRYAIVGAVAYVVDFSALFLLTEAAGIYHVTSATIAFLLGLVTNYSLSCTWVFRKRRLYRRSQEFFVFAVIGVVGVGFNALFIWIFADILLIHYLLAKIVSTGFVFLWNFSARKFILFR